MRVGVTLPQFRDDAAPALAAARDAEAAGLDGVFVFDHLWPIGRPGRPALHMLGLLGALAVETSRVQVGSLVARVGLLPDAVLVEALATVHHLTAGRFVAGLGVGDRLSREENLAFGARFAPAAERLASLAACCDALRALGVPVWVGGRSRATREVAVAHADALNLWEVAPEVVGAERSVPVTWGGQAHADTDLKALLHALSAAGAAWAVLAPVGTPWPEAIARIATAAAGVGEGATDA